MNVDGYYDPLLEMLDRAVTEKLLFPEHRAALLCASEPEKLLDLMETHVYPQEAVRRWMKQE